MANKYYQPGETRAGKVGDLFGSIARRYDLINDLQSFGLHRAWKRRLVGLAAPRTGERALDICCGTGDIAFALARRGAAVMGLDFSEPMLEVARAKAPARGPGSEGRGSVEFLRGDAEQLPFKDNRFEIVTVGYGLRNLASWERGLAEMERVARPGGRLLVLDFGKPDNAVWRGFYFAYLGRLVPIFGKVFCRNSQAYAYILESLRHYPAQHGIASKLREMGCADVRTVNLLGGVMSISCAVKRGA